MAPPSEFPRLLSLDQHVEPLAHALGVNEGLQLQPGLHLLGLALLSPSLLFLAIFTYWPTAQVMWQSLHAGSRSGGPFGLQN